MVILQYINSAYQPNEKTKTEWIGYVNSFIKDPQISQEVVKSIIIEHHPTKVDRRSIRIWHVGHGIQL